MNINTDIHKCHLRLYKIVSLVAKHQANGNSPNRRQRCWPPRAIPSRAPCFTGASVFVGSAPPSLRVRLRAPT